MCSFIVIRIQECAEKRKCVYCEKKYSNKKMLFEYKEEQLKLKEERFQFLLLHMKDEISNSDNEKLYEENNINQSIDQSNNTLKKQKQKGKIPPSMRILVWEKNIGLEKGNSLCLCFNKREISQMDFHCGHIVSDAIGGKIHIDNLLPVCAICNYSMSTEELFVHKDKLEKFVK